MMFTLPALKTQASPLTLQNGEPAKEDMNDNTWCDELLKDYDDKRWKWEERRL